MLDERGEREYNFPASEENPMKLLRQSVALCVALAFLTITTFADSGNNFKVRYNGGTLKTKIDPKDWDNHLTITSDNVLLELKDGQKVEFAAKNITGLSYGQEASRRVGTMVALAILISPVALFGLFHKKREHFIGVEYKDAEGKGVGVLLQGDKDNYRAIMTALEAVSGAPVSVSEKDREFVPGLANVHTVKESAPAPELATGNVSIASDPDGADVYLDGKFAGNAPSTLKIPAGHHAVIVKANGMKDWQRELDVSAGSDVKLNAKLEK
jgi:hypothetical protein